MIHHDRLTTSNMELEYSWIDYDLPLNPDIEVIRYDFFKNKLPTLFRKEEKATELILEAYENIKSFIQDPVIPNFLFQDERKEKYNKLFKNALKEIAWNKNIENINHIQVQEEEDIIILSYSDIHFEITKNLYDRMIQQIILDLPVNHEQQHSFLNTIIWSLYCRYDSLGLLSGYSGSVPSQIYNSLQKKYNCECECFGSFLNHELKYYFGLFYDLEKYFGCLGNFFFSTLKKGFYVCNPPFTVTIINKTIKKIENMVKKSSNLSLLFFIPVWDISDRILLNRYQKKNRIRAPYLVTNYKNDIISKSWYLKKDKYLRLYDLYLKYHFLYYDWVKERNMNYAATNVILYSNVNIDLRDMKEILPKPSISLLEVEERMAGTKRKRKTRKRRTRKRKYKKKKIDSSSNSITLHSKKK